ncbi:MAG: TetR/AcrR family transcriptional regulator, partial [Oscillospiraceae bacterium]|nr:TetR/AcrR family transcriptional regulator [Oscillospiraceae bacterium]
MALTKRDIKSMATKERIRNVALRLMRTHSIDEISVQDICTKANVGVGTFYHYYQAKDSIIHEVYYEMDAHFLRLAEEAERTPIGPYEYILRHFICYTRFVAETTVDFARKVYSLQSRRFLDRERPVYSTLKDYLMAKSRAGEISRELDIDDFCDYVNIWLRGIAFDWCLHDGNYDIVQRAIDCIDRVL